MMHPDFLKIYRNFITQYGEDKGKAVYYAWLNKYGLDDTKPLEPQLKKLKKEWLVKIDESYGKPLLIKGYAIHAGTTRNWNLYLEDELKNAADSLIGKPIYLEHVDVNNAVGKVLSAGWDPEERAIWFTAEVYDDEVADKIRAGIIKHVSICADYEILEPFDSIMIPHGLEFRELSLVAVPGDPETNIMVVESLLQTQPESVMPVSRDKSQSQKEIISISHRAGGEGVKMSEEKKESNEGTDKPLLNNKENTAVLERAVAPHETSKAPEDHPWDADAAEQRVRKWASSDGSGDKDKIDWAKYREAFAWYNAEDPENFGSYKLPHHDIVDGRFCVVWRGVAAAMAVMKGARGGVDIPEADRDAVLKHLIAHYKQFDKEVPESQAPPITGENSQEALNPQPQPAGEHVSAGGVGREVKAMGESVQPKGLVVEESSKAKIVESIKRGSLREQWEKPISLPSAPTARIATFVVRSEAVAGKPGDVVNIPYVRDFDLDILANVGDSLTPKTGLYATVQTTLKETAATTNIPYADVEKLTEDILAKIEERFSEGALRAIDKYILDTLIANTDVPELDKSTESVDFDADWIAEALGLLMKQGKSFEPGDCLLVINAKMYEALLKDIAATQSLVFARPDVVQKGVVTEFLGVKILVSNYLPEHDATNHKKSAYLIHKNSIVFAPKRELLLETQRDTAARSIKLTGSLTFGVAVLDNKAICEIKTPVV
jgi:hypothetical protein